LRRGARVAVVVVLVSVQTPTSLGCATFAVVTAPEKRPVPSTNALAKTAVDLFRQALEDGAYDDLPNAIEFLTAAYAENPDDPEVAFLLGMAHLWRFAERERLPRQARIIEHVILADKFLGEARRLAPRDARVEGFDAIAELVDGVVHRDEALKRHGYFALNEAVDDLPAFNLFVTSFVFGVMRRDDRLFHRAVDSAWSALERCTGLSIDSSHPDSERLRSRVRELSMGLPHDDPDRSICANASKAPFNVEGFLLHMGDLLVKDGRPDVARQLYELARSSVSFRSWPYADVLQKRITDSDARAQAYAAQQKDEPVGMASSSMACSGCHARKAPPVAEGSH
jgi:hypothetical protein